MEVSMQTSDEVSPEEAVGRGLAFFRAAGGAVQLVFPGLGTRLMGLPRDARSRWYVRTRGLRELVVHVGLVSSEHPAFAWMRLAGDVVDLGVLASQWNQTGTQRARLARTFLNTLTMTLADAAAVGLRAGGGEVEIQHTLTVDRPAPDIYRYLREPANLPRFTGDAGSIVGAVEIVEDVPDRRLMLRVSPPDGHEHLIGVALEPRADGHGTEVTLGVHGLPTGGPIARARAALTGSSPEKLVLGQLRQLKQVLEAGGRTPRESTGYRTGATSSTT
jgi:uncharacterized membrane protein